MSRLREIQPRITLTGTIYVLGIEDRSKTRENLVCMNSVCFNHHRECSEYLLEFKIQPNLDKDVIS